jgi:hypothetical protein
MLINEIFTSGAISGVNQNLFGSQLIRRSGVNQLINKKKKKKKSKKIKFN